MTILRKPLDMWLLWKNFGSAFQYIIQNWNMLGSWGGKYVIEYAYKFSLSKIGCIVARRPNKLKCIVLNFHYVQNKGNNICHLNHDL